MHSNEPSVFSRFLVVVASAFVLLAATPRPGVAGETGPIRIFTTTTDLADLAREVGGDRVTVTWMVQGREDAHFADARPSFIKELSQADLFIVVGLELEVGYVPLLLQNARNGRVLPGAVGYLDASRAITPLLDANVATAGVVNRSMGDVHAWGNPHYLLDPVRGFDVARLIAAKLAELRPQEAAYFQARLEDFRHRMVDLMVGPTLAAKYDAFKLAQLAEQGGLAAFLDQQGDRALLGGWYGALLPKWGSKVVDDHQMWLYFAKRFGLVVVDHMEPKPGIPPTTTHLKEVIEKMKAENVKIVLASPYYDPRHAAFVADATGAMVLQMAHQTGSRDHADTYLDMITLNVGAVTLGLGATK